MLRPVSIMGIAAPLWLLVGAAATAAAGVTVANVVAGQITGDLPVTISQALVLDSESQGACITVETATCNSHTISCSPGGTAFQAAVETFPGEYYELRLGLVNRSSQTLFGLLTVSYPSGFTVSVIPSWDRVDQVTQLTYNTWKFRVLQGAAGDRNNDGTIEDYLQVRVALSPELRPGFYSLGGRIEQLSY